MVDQILYNWVKAQRQGKLQGAGSKVKVNAEQMEISRFAGRIGARENGARYSGKSDGVLRKGIGMKYAFVQRNRRE